MSGFSTTDLREQSHLRCLAQYGGWTCGLEFGHISSHVSPGGMRWKEPMTPRRAVDPRLPAATVMDIVAAPRTDWSVRSVNGVAEIVVDGHRFREVLS